MRDFLGLFIPILIVTLCVLYAYMAGYEQAVQDGAETIRVLDDNLLEEVT